MQRFSSLFTFSKGLVDLSFQSLRDQILLSGQHLHHGHSLAAAGHTHDVLCFLGYCVCHSLDQDKGQKGCQPEPRLPLVTDGPSC